MYTEVKVSSTETYFVYGTSLTASKFYQYFQAWCVYAHEQDYSNTISFPSAGKVYLFVPNCSWQELGNGITLATSACVTVGSNSFTITNELYTGS